MNFNTVTHLAKAVSTVLKETFAAPRSGSYVLQSGDDHIVIRQGGHYPEVDFTGYNLSGLDLHGTDLSGATLRNANLTNTNLTGANLTGADLTGAIVTNAKFDNATIYDASFNDVRYEIAPSGIQALNTARMAN